MNPIHSLHPLARAWLLDGPLLPHVDAYLALLARGVDISVIALWLGHESPTTTHQYVEADLAMKEKTLSRLQDPNTPARRFRANDSLLDFLKNL